MNVNVALYANDLTSLHLTGNAMDDGRNQVCLDRIGGAIAAYLTVEEVRAIASAWTALADSLESTSHAAVADRTAAPLPDHDYLSDGF